MPGKRLLGSRSNCFSTQAGVRKPGKAAKGLAKPQTHIQKSHATSQAQSFKAQDSLLGTEVGCYRGIRPWFV